MDRLLEVNKALSDENRLRIFFMLQVKPMCVCELLQVLDIAGSTLSAHLKILRQAGLVDQRKDGRWIEYFLKVEESWVEQVLAYSETMLEEREIIDADRDLAATLTREVCSSR